MIKMQFKNSLKLCEIRCLMKYVTQKMNTKSHFLNHVERYHATCNFKRKEINPNYFLTINGKEITSPIKIANEFKNYFANLGLALSKKFSKSGSCFSDYLKDKSLN